MIRLTISVILYVAISYIGTGLIQTNSYHTSPAYQDIVQHTEYDPYGRQIFDFLPFTIEGADGRYLDTAYVNTLYVYVAIDENGNQSKTFKDKSGKVVLKETSLSGTRLRTYYIADAG